MSILMLYRRIFGVGNAYFRNGWWLNVFFAYGYTVALVEDTLTQCAKVEQLWDPNAPPEACRTSSPVSLYVFAGLNSFSDLWILSLPIPIIWGLQMPRRQKLVTCGLFLMGFL